MEPNDVPIVDIDDEDNPTPLTDLEKAVRLAKLQVAQERAVAEAEEALDRAKKALRRTREADLPDALAVVKLSSITIEGGYVIEIVKEVFGAIPKGREDEAIEWMIADEHGDLVKNTIELNLPRGAVRLAARIVGGLRKLNGELESDEKFELKQKQTIHWQTLQKFIRDAEAAGRDDLPVDLLGIYRRRVSNVIPPGTETF